MENTIICFLVFICLLSFVNAFLGPSPAFLQPPAHRACDSSSPLTGTPVGLEAESDSVGPGIYGGSVLLDDVGNVVIGQQFEVSTDRSSLSFTLPHLRQPAELQPHPRPSLRWKWLH